jgi:hypothetical protein
MECYDILRPYKVGFRSSLASVFMGTLFLVLAAEESPEQNRGRVLNSNHHTITSRCKVRNQGRQLRQQTFKSQRVERGMLPTTCIRSVTVAAMLPALESVYLPYSRLYQSPHQRVPVFPPGAVAHSACGEHPRAPVSGV